MTLALKWEIGGFSNSLVRFGYDQLAVIPGGSNIKNQGHNLSGVNLAHFTL
jgi:hypothetical protein